MTTSGRRFRGGSESRGPWLVLFLIVMYLGAMGFAVTMQERSEAMLYCEICGEPIGDEPYYTCRLCDLPRLCRACVHHLDAGDVCDLCYDITVEIIEKHTTCGRDVPH